MSRETADEFGSEDVAGGSQVDATGFVSSCVLC